MSGSFFDPNVSERIFLKLRPKPDKNDNEYKEWNISKNLFINNAILLDNCCYNETNRDDEEQLIDSVEVSLEAICKDLLYQDGDISYYLPIYQSIPRVVNLGKITCEEIESRKCINYSIGNDTYNDYSNYLKGRGYSIFFIELMVEHEDEKESPEWKLFMSGEQDPFYQGIIDSHTNKLRKTFNVTM